MFQKIAKECLAGFTVAIVALPLAIAFGIAATGTSEGALVGLYGAIFCRLICGVIWWYTWAGYRPNWTDYGYCNRGYCDARIRGEFYSIYDGGTVSNFIRCM